MEGNRFLLEAVGHLLAAPLAGACKSNFGRDIENEGEVGLEVADAYAFKRADEKRIKAPESALVDSRGVDKSIADNPRALRKRGLDGAAHVVATGSGEQQRFGFYAERLGNPSKQHVADHFGAGRTAGLTSEHHLNAGRL